MNNRALTTPALVALIALGFGPPVHAQFVLDREKSDSLRLRNGDWVIGDLRDMALGIVTYETDAMSTIYVKWTRVLTAITEKRFQIYLDDGRRYYGSLRPGSTLGRVMILTELDTLDVPIQSVVELQRIRGEFWHRIDGDLDFGFGFTQQNERVDLSLRSDTRYLFSRNRLSLLFVGTLSRQDSVSDVTRGTGRLTYFRELTGLWFVGLAASVEQNSQLSLDVRGSMEGGPGRYFVANNRMELGSFVSIGYSRERFTGENARNTVALGVITDLKYFDWSGRSTDLSSRLAIQPVLNDPGRWRVSFAVNVKQEMVSDLYLRIGVVEEYDSRPPSLDANRNDFSITTSLGWKY